MVEVEPEYELIDTGIFAEDRYFDVTVEYAKVEPEDILVRITAANRGPEAAPLHVLPTLWFRNTWAWGYDHDEANRRPELRAVEARSTATGEERHYTVRATHATLESTGLRASMRSMSLNSSSPRMRATQSACGMSQIAPLSSRTALTTLWCMGPSIAVNPEGFGTKVAAHYTFVIAPGATESVMLRLSATQHDDPFADAEKIFEATASGSRQLLSDLWREKFVRGRTF